jgi:Protein of unknown function (DUF1236)
MQKILKIAACAAIASALPQLALAQTSGQNQSSPSIQTQVKNNLAQAGYSDIRVMPESFLVRAKDKDGNPVMMIINPDSFTTLTAIPEQRGNTNTADQTGQTTSKSAKMTDNSVNSSSRREANQTTSRSSKMSAGATEDIDGQKIPGRANGMVAEVKQDESRSLNLTVAQRSEIWKELGSTASAQVPSNAVKVGETVPGTMSLHSMPGSVTSHVPAVTSYDYAMVHGQLLIVDPSTKKVAAIVTE